MTVKPEENTGPAGDVPVLLKIGAYFIPSREIHSVARFGKGSKIMLNNGNELVVNLNYDKVTELVNFSIQHHK